MKKDALNLNGNLDKAKEILSNCETMSDLTATYGKIAVINRVFLAKETNQIEMAIIVDDAVDSLQARLAGRKEAKKNDIADIGASVLSSILVPALVSNALFRLIRTDSEKAEKVLARIERHVTAIGHLVLAVESGRIIKADNE